MGELPSSIWLHWHGHPDAVIGLIILQSAYLIAIGPVRKKYGLSPKPSPKQTVLFTTGVLIIFLSLLSPLHIMSDDYLFSAHMVQHVLLTLVSPPLLILGTPGWLISPLVRKSVALKIAKVIVHPVSAVVVFNLVFSIWHLPVLYELSVSYHSVHVGEHLLFMMAAVVMWWPICSVVPELPRLSYPLQLIYLFVMSLAQIVVFGIITFAPEPIYEHYVEAPRLWNITPLMDQQIGGIIMKVGSGFLFLTLIIIVFFKWFEQGSREDSNDIIE
tara:strand:- start:565 stop:1380 length:816 start_codon:yes stop_codon:yes gene_type:complete